MLNDNRYFTCHKMLAMNLYGDGYAVERICEGLLVASDEKVIYVC